jgi:hypothetical protein
LPKTWFDSIAPWALAISAIGKEAPGARGEGGKNPPAELVDQDHSFGDRSRSHHRPDDLEPAAQDPGDVHLRGARSLQRAQDHQPAPWLEHREVLGQGRAPEEVEDHVDRLVEPGRKPTSGRVDPLVHPERGRALQLGGRPRGADHGRPHPFRQLDRDRTDPASDRVDQNPLAGGHVGPDGQGVVCGQKRFGYSRRDGIGHPGRDRDRLGGSDHHQLGVTAAADQPHHPVPHRQTFDARA